VSGTLVDDGLAKAVATAEFRRDPYPVYHRFLDAPGWRTPSGYRVFSRYQDVMTILRQPVVFGQEGVPYPNFHVLDPPDHTRIRRLVAKAFTPRAVARQEAEISAIVDDLVDGIAGRGAMDLITELALHLPARVAAAMLDVPIDDAAQWHAWLHAVGGFRGKVWYLGKAGTDAEQRRAKEAATESAAYFERLIGEREAMRGNDIVSALLEVRDDGDRLSRDEVLFSLVLLLGGGLHTTASQIGNTVRALLEHPEALAAVTTDPGLVEGAVEEALRVDGALQVEYRITRRDTELAGVALPARTPIMIVPAAANRDPAVFENPDRFDVRRENAAQHLTFGWGIHRCLGAQLARLELQLVIHALVTRLPGLRLAGPPVQHPYDRWRGLSSLRVAWDVV
jgi:cytochrome P450